MGRLALFFVGALLKRGNRGGHPAILHIGGSAQRRLPKLDIQGPRPFHLGGAPNLGPLRPFSVELNRRCEQIWESLCAYSDGEASEEEANRVEAHLRDCPECRRALHVLQQSARALREGELVPPPPDLRERILAATVGRPTARTQWAILLRLLTPRRLAAPALCGATLAAAIVIALASKGPHPAFKVFGGAIQPEIPVAAHQPISAAPSTPAPPGLPVTASRPVPHRPIRRIAMEPAAPSHYAPPPVLSTPSAELKARPRLQTLPIPPQENARPAEAAPNASAPVQVAASTTVREEPAGPGQPATNSGVASDAAPAPAPPPAEVHIQLAAGDMVNAQAYASLAGLKRTLQRHSDTAWTLADGDAEDRRVLTVDLYRSRF